MLWKTHELAEGESAQIVWVRRLMCGVCCHFSGRVIACTLRSQGLRGLKDSRSTLNSHGFAKESFNKAMFF